MHTTRPATTAVPDPPAPRDRPTRRPRAVELVVAAAGFGKSAALEATSLESGSVLHRHADLIGWLADENPDRLALGPDGRPVARLLVDEFDRLTSSQQRKVARGLAAVGHRTTVTVASARPITTDLRTRLGHPTVERAPAELCLDETTVVSLLSREFGLDQGIARQVYAVTRGWPALVVMAGDALQGYAETSGATDDVLPALMAPGSAVGPWLQRRVVRRLPAPARTALRVASVLGPVDADLMRTLALARGDDPRSALNGLDVLRRLGLVLPTRTGWAPSSPPMEQVVPVLGAWVGAHDTVSRRHELRTAAQWYADRGLSAAAAQAWHRAGEPDGCRRVLVSRGDSILAAGGASQFLRLAAPGRDETPYPLRLLVGEARRMTGDMAGAHRTLQPLTADPARAADPALAWRLAMVHYACADYAAADETCGRVPDDAPPSVDLVRTWATRASAAFMLGRQQTSERLAARALDLAVRLDDDQALVAAHVAGGLVGAGARRDDHLAAALLAAERTGNAVMAARILLNQAGNSLVAADFRQALTLAERASAAAEWGSPPATRASALHNAGEALARLGRFDEAVDAFTRSVQVCRGHGLARTPAGLWGLAEVDRQRGRLDEARAGYAEVVDLALGTGEVQVLVPALLGWVRCLAESLPMQPRGGSGAAADAEPGLAADAYAGLAAELSRSEEAYESTRHCSLAVFAPALMTIQGWTAWCRQDAEGALGAATAAVAAAREQRNRTAVADALELAVAVSPDARQRRAHLTDLLKLWEEAGADVSADLVRVQIGALPGADAAQRADAKAATRRLVQAGVRIAGSSGPGAEPSDVVVRVLGPFEVTVNGADVPLPAWRSRQARSLLKILVAARGRPLTRDFLCEALWPDDVSEKTGHRLSVLLNAVRNVLDPGRRLPPDHFLRSDADTVRLDLTKVDVDLEEFLRGAREADVLARGGDHERAREVLVDVEALYRGEAFEDDPYQEWADAAREETRAWWSRALRLSADLAARTGHRDQAVGCLVRLLSDDPYDEEAHRTLVDLLLAAGRHGEARRRLGLWRQAMRSLGAPPPDHWLLHEAARSAGRRRTGPPVRPAAARVDAAGRAAMIRR